MNHAQTGFGIWGTLLLLAALVAALLFSVVRSHRLRSWRGVGAFVVFLLAVVGERFGLPFTLALWTGRVLDRQVGSFFWPHDTLHMLDMVFGWEANQSWGPIELLASVLIVGGIVLLVHARRVLRAAKREHRLARAGIYAASRHPEYLAFLLIAFGFLLQWPGWIALALYPALVRLYAHFARQEEAALHIEFGDAYQQYAAATSRFLPRWRSAG